MRVAVIGAGVVGMSTAYFLARNGHRVSVIERHGNVCEQASLGHAGLLGAAHLTPLAAAGMPRRIISQWFNADAVPNLKASFKPSQWRWLRSWMRECTLERMLANKEKMQRLGKYGQQLLNEISHLHQLDFQQRSGILHLFRQAKQQNNIHAGLDLLSQSDIPFQLLDAAACRGIEPALNPHTELAGGVYFPTDSQGNCVLFAKQLKNILQQMGVEFAFLTECTQISPNTNGVTLQLKSAEQYSAIQFDTLVLAAGEQSAAFFNTLGIALKVAPMQSFSNTANIKNIEDSPRLSIIDESNQVAMTRMDKRTRIAGTILSGSASSSQEQRAWQVLRNTGEDWFPDAANYSSGINWSGRHLMLPDNAPLLGQIGAKNIFINVAHAEHGWAMALGSGKALADLISGQAPEIDLAGLGITR